MASLFATLNAEIAEAVRITHELQERRLFIAAERHADILRRKTANVSARAAFLGRLEERSVLGTRPSQAEIDALFREQAALHAEAEALDIEENNAFVAGLLNG